MYFAEIWGLWGLCGVDNNEGGANAVFWVQWQGNVGSGKTMFITIGKSLSNIQIWRNGHFMQYCVKLYVIFLSL